MKITAESSVDQVPLSAGPCRVFLGVTKKGVPFTFFVRAIAFSAKADISEFEQFFGEAPCAVHGIHHHPSAKPAAAPAAEPSLERRIAPSYTPAEAFMLGGLYAIGLCKLAGEPDDDHFLAQLRAYYYSPAGFAVREGLMKKLHRVNDAIAESGFTTPAAGGG